MTTARLKETDTVTCQDCVKHLDIDIVALGGGSVRVSERFPLPESDQDALSAFNTLLDSYRSKPGPGSFGVRLVIGNKHKMLSYGAFAGKTDKAAEVESSFFRIIGNMRKQVKG